ncbi:MAG: RNA polymerase subunit sigma-70 [Actinomycetota bacterium]
MKQGAKLANAAGSSDPVVGLRAVASLRLLVEDLEELQVTNARGRGWSWQEIAVALGVSKQAVHKKYASRRILRRGR